MRVLILQAGFNEIGVIQNLKKEGHYVIAIGNQPGLIGQKYVDEYYCQDYSKMDEVLAFANDNDIDYICACCNDTAVLTAVYVAEKMNLQGYDSYESSEIIAHKNLFKRFAKKNEIMSVHAEEFNSLSDANKYVSKGIEYPVIVKPVDLSGGKGVSKCSNDDETCEAISNAFSISRTKCIVIEPFIEGTQHGFCTFLHNKKVIACCSNNEISVVNPYRVEIDTFPADNIDKYEEILIQQVELMAEKLNLVDGIFHVQYMECNGKIYILEAMRRIIGNMYSIPASKACNFDWDYWQARASIGESCEAAPTRMQQNGFFAYRAIIPDEDGIIKEIKIDKSLEPYIFNRIILEEIGTKVENHKAWTVGLVFFNFENQKQMNEIMIDNYDKIYVEMEHC